MWLNLTAKCVSFDAFQKGGNKIVYYFIISTVPVKCLDTLSHSNEWEGVSKLFTGTVYIHVIDVSDLLVIFK